MKNLSSISHSKTQEIKLELGEKDWYDFWHIHLDMNGDGNSSEEKHREFIIENLTLFQNFREQANNFKKSWQCWIVIDPTDSSQDAIYFHTENPNHDNFPCTFEFVKWGIDMPDLLTGLINLTVYEIGQSDYNGFRTYWIKSKND
jgi:hypothetical protein